MINEKLFYTVKDIQQLIGCGRDKAYALANSKSFPSTKIGKTFYINKEEFDKWCKKNAYSEFII